MLDVVTLNGLKVMITLKDHFVPHFLLALGEDSTK